MFSAVEIPSPESRIVGKISGPEPGPTVIVMTGIHGNEWAGLLAARRMLDRLREEEIPLRGDLTVLAGNLSALRERTRFIDDDLNRNWTPARIDALRSVSEFDGLNRHADAFE